MLLFLALWTLQQHEDVQNPLKIFEVLLVEIQVTRHIKVRLHTVGVFFCSFHKNN